MTLPRLFHAGLATAALLAGIAACTLAAVGREADPERGRYLVERVALCADCHSPRDEQGRFVAARWLQGAPLPFAPTVPMPWAPVAKPIAGLPGLGDAEALALLTTGALPDGRRPLPPMPEYRFSEPDARDVIAYLRRPAPPAADAADAR
ncbi:MAG: hypothetical protein KF830_14050 [Planctomycetes bacterium]|nr:hypothetical protein [Planctomycetota bacterium]